MRLSLIAATIAGLAAMPALAQPADAPPAGRPTTRAEIQAAAQTQFTRLDANHDGAITRDEFETARNGTATPPAAGAGGDSSSAAPMRRGRGMMGGLNARWFDRVDADGDGRVTLAEVQAAATTLFDMADTDHDGTISPAERAIATELMRAKRLRGN
jgi:hypothetical protein